MSSVLCADLGGTRTRVALFDAGGELAQKQVTPTDDGDPGSLVAAMRDVLAKAGGTVEGAVIGVPGPVSYRDGVPLLLPNLPRWEGALSARALSDALGLRVLLANDADLAALGEHRYGAGRGCADLLYVTSSTGVGGGVIIGGKLLHGHWSLAEVGHMVIDRATGATVEDLGSGSALERLAGDDGAEITRRARAGHERALAPFRDVAGAFATGVHNAVHCFMPERVVIGGGVSQAGDLLLGPVREQLDACPHGPSARGEDVVLARGGDDVGLLGGFAYWLDEGRAG